LGRANDYDSRKPILLVESMRQKRKKPKERVYADKGCSRFIAKWYLRKKGISGQIPSRARKRHLRRPRKLDEDAYKEWRSSVKRFFSMLKRGFRTLAIMYERLASTCLGFI